MDESEMKQEIPSPALTHSIGLALPDNQVLILLQKGTPLPFRKRKVFRSDVALDKGQNGQLLRFPVVEGERSRADRNRIVGTLEVSAERIARDLPAGSEIEVTIEIDQSRLIRTKAYIAILDEEFENVLHLESKVPDAKELTHRLRNARKRLEDLRARAETTGDAPQTLPRLFRLSDCRLHTGTG